MSPEEAYRDLRARKSRGDNKPGALLTMTPLPRECSVDVATRRGYVRRGLQSDVQSERGAHYFLASRRDEYRYLVTHFRAAQMATVDSS